MIAKAWLLGLALLGAMVGCSSAPAETSVARPERVGAVALKLHVLPGVDLRRVAFEVRNPALLGQPRTGSVDVSQSQGIEFVVGGLPAGSGYTVSFTGTLTGTLPTDAGSPGASNCSGAASFDVVGNTTAAVPVSLVCGAGAPDAGSAGSIAVLGTASLSSPCAAVTSLSASPSEADVGGAMLLSATGVDSVGTGADVSLDWSLGSTPIGSLSAASGGATVFTCLAPGTATVTVTATAGDAAACAASPSTASMTLVCDAVCTRVLRAGPPIATGLGPVSLAIGDLNGDSKPDLVVANSAFGRPGSVSVLLGKGDGTFAPQVVYASGGNVPSSVALGDVNGDAKLDVLVTNYNSNNVSVLLGRGDGTLGSPVAFATGSLPSMVALGDVNGDGKLDLAVASFAPDTIGPDVLLGNGDGTFQARVAYATDLGGANSLALADLNGDGRLDLAVPTNSTNAVSVLLGNGDGTFRPHAAIAAGASPWSVAAGDLNGDGNADLAVTNVNGNNLTVLLGKGDGTFRPQAVYATGPLPWFVAIGDLNGDGEPDLAVANNGSNDVGVLLGHGDGTFQDQVTYRTGAFPSSLATGDLNADGKLDLAVTNQGGVGSASVFLGSCGP